MKRWVSPSVLAVLVACLVFAVLPLGTAHGSGPTPEIFTSFTPSQHVPGNWTEEKPSDALRPVDTGAGVCFPGTGRLWTGDDGSAFALSWWTCPEEAARYLADEAFADRLRMGRTTGAESYLGGADAVFPLDNHTAVRKWVQGPYSIQLWMRCATLTFPACGRLTGPPARGIAAELPSEPRVTFLLPPFTRVLSSILSIWIFLVGTVTLAGWAVRPRFDTGRGDARLVAVDGKARAFRWRHRGQRFAYAVAVLAGMFLLGALLPPHDSVAATSARLGAAALLVGVAVGIHVACRHQATGPAIPLRRRLRIARPSPRRVVGAAVAMLLAVVFSTVPVVMLFALIILGLLAHTTNSGLSESSALLLPAVGLVVIAALGTLFDRFARRLRMRNAWEAIEADPRPHILYLRNFGDDQQKLPVSALSRSGLWQVLTGWLNPVRRSRFEEVLAKALSAFGPVIAVDQPGTRFSRLGAAKSVLMQEGWLMQVTRWAHEAHAVVVSATPDDIRPGLRDELRMIANALPHGRVVLILGPRRRRTVLHVAFDRFLREVRNYPIFASLTRWPVADGTLVLVHLPQRGWGSWRGWSARRRTAWTYTAAIHEAMSVASSVWGQPDAEAVRQ
ncbi:hypothetical protein ACGFIR_30360 [Micromonospora sp. NPDC049051]|uniref:hypothetical protein n=1 Tax=Micromonospora sp. NPDC049051 TaxID=3364264 RepID=UPI00371F2155